MKSKTTRKQNVFLETVGDIFHIVWFTVYNVGIGLQYVCRAPIRALMYKFGYDRSHFHKITGISKKDFRGGSSWNTGNAPRHIVCNAIGTMKLPLEAVSVEYPRDDEESLMYYHLYNGTIIVTHGFYRASMWDHGEYYIDRNPACYPGTAVRHIPYRNLLKWLGCRSFVRNIGICQSRSCIQTIDIVFKGGKPTRMICPPTEYSIAGLET